MDLICQLWVVNALTMNQSRVAHYWCKQREQHDYSIKYDNNKEIKML